MNPAILDEWTEIPVNRSNVNKQIWDNPAATKALFRYALEYVMYLNKATQLCSRKLMLM